MKTLHIIIAFCGGLFIGHLLFPSEKEINSTEIVRLLKQKESIARIDTSYRAHSLLYQKQSDSLSKQLKGYMYLLTKSKIELYSKRTQIATLLKGVERDKTTSCDSLLPDSLSNRIAFLNLATDSIIALYERKDSLWEKAVAIRDSQIVQCDRSFIEMKNLAQEQMMREQKLTDDLNTVLKQQKRKRLQNRMLAAGMLFVSGITTTLIIKSRQ